MYLEHTFAKKENEPASRWDGKRAYIRLTLFYLSMRKDTLGTYIYPVASYTIKLYLNEGDCHDRPRGGEPPGHLQIESGPGEGTRIEALLPVQKEEAST